MIFLSLYSNDMTSESNHARLALELVSDALRASQQEMCKLCREQIPTVCRLLAQQAQL